MFPGMAWAPSPFPPSSAGQQLASLRLRSYNRSEGISPVSVHVCVLNLFLLLSQLEEFVERHGGAAGFGPAALAVEQALERTRINIRWLQDNRQQLYDWFTCQAHRSG